MPDPILMGEAFAAAAALAVAVALLFRISSRAEVGTAGAVLAVLSGFYAGLWILGLLPRFPPREDMDRLLLIVLPGAAVAEVVAAEGRRSAWIARGAIAAVTFASPSAVSELAEALEVLSVDAPVVIVFDDLQWTDPSTAELLAFLASRREPARLLIVGTYRPEEVPRGQPLTRVTSELIAHRQASSISLGGLGSEAVDAYLSKRFQGHAFPPELARTLEQRRRHVHAEHTSARRHLLRERDRGGSSAAADVEYPLAGARRRALQQELGDRRFLHDRDQRFEFAEGDSIAGFIGKGRRQAQVGSHGRPDAGEQHSSTHFRQKFATCTDHDCCPFG